MFGAFPSPELLRLLATIKNLRRITGFPHTVAIKVFSSYILAPISGQGGIHCYRREKLGRRWDGVFRRTRLNCAKKLVHVSRSLVGRAGPNKRQADRCAHLISGRRRREGSLPSVRHFCKGECQHSPMDGREIIGCKGLLMLVERNAIDVAAGATPPLSTTSHWSVRTDRILMQYNHQEKRKCYSLACMCVVKLSPKARFLRAKPLL